MPEVNQELSEALVPVEPAQHTYMQPGLDETVILDTTVQGVIDAFKRERLELGEKEDNASNLSVKVDADLSKLTEQLGGIEGIQALAHVLSDPNANLAQILPQTAVEDLVWSALDNPVTQANVLADPEVRAIISKELLNGHSIEAVQDLLSEYERGDGLTPEQLDAEYLAAEARVLKFQRDFFTSGIDETVKSSGVDESNIDAVADRLLLARTRFLDANHQEYLYVQSLHERGLSSQALIPEARLHNKWTASLLNELEKLAKVGTKKTSAKNTNDSRASNEITSSESYDLSDPNWVHAFTKEFHDERVKRGL